MAPRVTVVIATYNRAALLMETIESVLRQSYRDFEVLVCDDGSTDDTAACVTRSGPPVHYLGLEHRGRPGWPRNRGIEAARGELVAFVDDDDLWEPEKLGRQVELFDRDSALNLVYTDRQLLPASGSSPAIVRTPAPARADQLLDLVLRRQMPFVGSWLVRRELLLRVGGFDETLVTGEDLDLLLRLAPSARIAGVPEPLVLVRRQPGSVSDRAGPLTFENAVLVLERWLATNRLSWPDRRRARKMLAHLHTGLAASLREQGDAAGSWRAAVGAIRHAPGRRASWTAWSRSLYTALRAP